MLAIIFDTILFLAAYFYSISFLLAGYEFQKVVDNKFFNPKDLRKIKESANKPSNKYSFTVVMSMIIVFIVSIIFAFNGNMWNTGLLWLLLFSAYYKLDWAKRVRNLENK